MDQQYFLRDVHGRPITLVSAARRAEFVKQGRSQESFLETPDWVMEVVRDLMLDNSIAGPLYFYQTTPMSSREFWVSRFGTGEPDPAPPGFWEQFTMSMGPLTGEEVRREEERFRVQISDHVAVSSYNNWQQRNMKLYHGQVSAAEIREHFSDNGHRERFDRVHNWVSSMIDSEVEYFGWDEPHPVDDELPAIEGIRQFKFREARLGYTLGIVFTGPKCMRRDVFNDGGRVYPPSAMAINLPGRDREQRFMGVNLMFTYLMSPHLLLTHMYIGQLQEGRQPQIQKPPILPQDMLYLAV